MRKYRLAETQYFSAADLARIEASSSTGQVIAYLEENDHWRCTDVRQPDSTLMEPGRAFHNCFFAVGGSSTNISKRFKRGSMEPALLVGVGRPTDPDRRGFGVLQLRSLSSSCRYHCPSLLLLKVMCSLYRVSFAIRIQQKYILICCHSVFGRAGRPNVTRDDN